MWFGWSVEGPTLFSLKVTLIFIRELPENNWVVAGDMIISVNYVILRNIVLHIVQVVFVLFPALITKKGV